MAGDAFDTVNPPAKAEQLFYDSLSRLSDKGKRPVVVISGNHDNPDRLSAASPIAYDSNIHLIGYPSAEVLSIPVKDEQLNVAALAYPSEARLEQLLSEVHDEILLRDHYDEKIRDLFQKMTEGFSVDAVNVAMSHLYVAGGSSTDSERPIEVGGAYTVRATSLPESAQYVALGHLHRPQNVKKALTNARYSGSPLAYSFSESGYAKSVSIIDVHPKEEANVSEVFLSSGKPLVKWKAQEGLQQVYRWIDEGKDRNAWIDLEIQLTDQLSIEEIHRLRKAHEGFVHIRPIFEHEMERFESTKKEQLPIDEVFKRFYAKQTGGAEANPELVQLFLSLIHEEERGGEA